MFRVPAPNDSIAPLILESRHDAPLRPLALDEIKNPYGQAPNPPMPDNTVGINKPGSRVFLKGC